MPELPLKPSKESKLDGAVPIAIISDTSGAKHRPEDDGQYEGDDEASPPKAPLVDFDINFGAGARLAARKP